MQHLPYLIVYKIDHIRLQVLYSTKFIVHVSDSDMSHTVLIEIVDVSV